MFTSMSRQPHTESRRGDVLIPLIRAAATIGFAVVPSSLGFVIVAVSEQLIRAIMVGDDPEMLVSDLQNQFPNDVIEVADDEPLVAKVVQLIEHPDRPADLPIDMRGSDFQLRVWRALQDVPAGETVSYQSLADRIGAPQAAAAVAAACSANPLAVAVPCHRAVPASGELAGCRWGAELQRALIERETMPIAAKC